MTDDFGIWEVDEATKASHPLEKAGQADTEALLEDIIVQNPAMLMQGLELVGRQLSTVGNNTLDLLGVDSDGRLVVFELKRGKLTREAVAQAVDYASWLDSLEDAELHTQIGENSGRRGIVEIGNFEEWYRNRNPVESLRPVRIVLVGLGADESARRMADWLAAKGVDIDLLTFLGYRHGDRMLLARQLESGEEARKQGRRARNASRSMTESRREDIESKVDEYGMRDWWPDAIAMLDRNSRRYYTANLGITFYWRPPRTLSTGKQAWGPYKIEIAGKGVVRIVFFPAAVDLCVDEFEGLRTGDGVRSRTAA